MKWTFLDKFLLITSQIIWMLSCNCTFLSYFFLLIKHFFSKRTYQHNYFNNHTSLSVLTSSPILAYRCPVTISSFTFWLLTLRRDLDLSFDIFGYTGGKINNSQLIGLKICRYELFGLFNFHSWNNHLDTTKNLTKMFGLYLIHL